MKGPSVGIPAPIMGAIPTNNNLLQGENHCRVPALNMAKLQKHTYRYVRQMMAVSQMHGTPSTAFLHHLWVTTYSTELAR